MIERTINKVISLTLLYFLRSFHNNFAQPVSLWVMLQG
jgi:hypothetical protein